MSRASAGTGLTWLRSVSSVILQDACLALFSIVKAAGLMRARRRVQLGTCALLPHSTGQSKSQKTQGMGNLSSSLQGRATNLQKVWIQGGTCNFAHFCNLWHRYSIIYPTSLSHKFAYYKVYMVISSVWQHVSPHCCYSRKDLSPQTPGTCYTNML